MEKLKNWEKKKKDIGRMANKSKENSNKKTV